MYGDIIPLASLLLQKNSLSKKNLDSFDEVIELKELIKEIT